MRTVGSLGVHAIDVLCTRSEGGVALRWLGEGLFGGALMGREDSDLAGKGVLEVFVPCTQPLWTTEVVAHPRIMRLEMARRR